MSARLDSNYKVILSADIVGSTALYETLGDAAAQSLVAEYLHVTKRHCAGHNGRVAAEIGDQILAVFAAPVQAASAASEIHVDLSERQVQADGPRVRMRIGLHYGPLASAADTLVGTTAKVAQWVGNHAKPEQTLATRAIIEQLPRVYRAVSRYVDDETWELASLEHMELYEIVWDVEAITAYGGEPPPRDANSYDAVEFSYAGQTVRIDLAHPVISIGRDTRNDLVINQDLVSRQHLRAQFSRGRCTITDNSTNGSLVELGDGDCFELKRESLRLAGGGRIIVGKPATAVDDFAIKFRCV